MFSKRFLMYSHTCESEEKFALKMMWSHIYCSQTSELWIQLLRLRKSIQKWHQNEFSILQKKLEFSKACLSVRYQGLSSYAYTIIRLLTCKKGTPLFFNRQIVPGSYLLLLLCDIKEKTQKSFPTLLQSQRREGVSSNRVNLLAPLF